MSETRKPSRCSRKPSKWYLHEITIRKNRWSKSVDDTLHEEGELGLLDGIASKPKTAQKEDSAITVFLNLVDFYKRNHREPDQSNPDEKTLYWQLMGYRTRPELRARVIHLDSVGLLKSSVAAKIPEPEKEEAYTESNVKSLSDIFDDDDLDLLDDIDTSIYAVKHVSQKKDKELPDEIASRKPCEDFFRYEKFFQDIHKVLPTKMVMKEGIVQESNVKVVHVFILNGLLCLVDNIIKEDMNTAVVVYQHIIDGTITQYRMDNTSEKIVKK